MSRPRSLEMERCCLFAPDGRLLWRSPAWLGHPLVPSEEATVLGFRYLEFVRAEHVAELLAWFRDGRESAISFCAMRPASGRMVRVSFAKLHHPRGWLVYGRVSPCRRCRMACRFGAVSPALALFLLPVLALLDV